jgi:hypothetical protein
MTRLTIAVAMAEFWQLLQRAGLGLHDVAALRAAAWQQRAAQLAGAGSSPSPSVPSQDGAPEAREGDDVSSLHLGRPLSKRGRPFF